MTSFNELNAQLQASFARWVAQQTSLFLLSD
jgi:hypothetical protein